jgi:hypothetical protein
MAPATGLATRSKSATAALMGWAAMTFMSQPTDQPDCEGLLDGTAVEFPLFD